LKSGSIERAKFQVQSPWIWKRFHLA